VKSRYWLVLISLLAILVAGCSEPDQEKELKEFFDYVGTPSTTPPTDLKGGGDRAKGRSDIFKTKRGEWYSIMSLENHKKIEASLKVAATKVPEIGYWLDSVVNNGSPWKIWDLDGQKVPDKAWARTYATLLGDEVQTCDTYLDMADIKKDQNENGLGPNFLALILAHEASHCKYDDEVKGVWAERTIMTRLGDERLKRLVEIHEDCIGPDKRWEKECASG